MFLFPTTKPKPMIYRYLILTISVFLLLTSGELLAGDQPVQKGLRDELEVIRSEYDRLYALTDSIRIQGRLLPGERQFLYVQKDQRGRFELEFDQTTGRVRCFRLDDGQTFFKLDEQALSLGSRKDREKTWLSLCNEYSLYENPLFEGRQLSLGGWCDFFRKVIDGDPSVDEWGQAYRKGILTITLDNSSHPVVRIVVGSKFNPRGTAFVLMVDRSKGAALVRWERHDGADDPKQWVYDLVVENSFAEVAQGIWVLKSGTSKISDVGTAPLASGRIGNVKQSVVVDSVELGDFVIPENFFSPHSLPIKAGTHVEDYRVEPTAHYYYSGGAIDTNILHRKANVP